MQIIISPAKKMRVDTDSFAWRDLPRFLSQTEQIFSQLKSYSFEELKSLWKCNDKIAAQNMERLRTLDLHTASCGDGLRRDPVSIHGPGCVQ